MDSLDTHIFRHALEAIPDGIVIMDGNGHPLVVNKMAAKILNLGNSYKDVHAQLGKTLGFDPLQCLAYTVRELLINDVYYSVCLSPIEKGGIRQGVFIYFKDKAAVQEAETIKTDFVSIASHELRNPLTSIKNALQILQTTCSGECAEQQKKFLDIAVRNAERISMLVDQYLNMSRIESGKIPFQCSRVNLEECIKAVLKEFKDKALEKQIILDDRLPYDLPYVLADPAKLEQIFTNLLTNAMKFTNPGGRITILAQVARLSDETDQGLRPMVEIQVADTGIGIPEKHQERIFEKFYRIKRTEETIQNGVGLGLAIVKRLVEMHGGRICVEKNQPNGSRFCFQLPIYAAERRDPIFRWMFDREFEKARKNQADLALFVVIIENIQNLLSADAGDEDKSIMEDMKTAIQRCLHRRTDIVIQRRDGEMFAVFCEAEKEDAHSIAGRIRLTIVGSLEQRFGKMVNAADVHIGFSTYPQDAVNQRELYRQALQHARGEHNA